MKPHPTKSKPRIAPYLAPRPPAPRDEEWAKRAAEVIKELMVVGDGPSEVNANESLCARWSAAVEEGHAVVSGLRHAPDHSALLAEVERYRRHMREKIYVDATPDDGLPTRILSAHIDESEYVSNPDTIGILMNDWQRERNTILREAIAGLQELATLRRERDELRAELLTTHQMACRVGLERDELAKMLETECNTLQVELVEAERKFQDGFDCVPFCELSSAANALLSRIRAALQSLRALTERPGKP